MNPLFKLIGIIVTVIVVFYLAAAGYIWLSATLKNRETAKVKVAAIAEPKCHQGGDSLPISIKIHNTSDKITQYVDTHFDITFEGEQSYSMTVTDREFSPIQPGETKTKCYALDPKAASPEGKKITRWRTRSTAEFLPSYQQTKEKP